jgi:hypothetical protein
MQMEVMGEILRRVERFFSKEVRARGGRDCGDYGIKGFRWCGIIFF